MSGFTVSDVTIVTVSYNSSSVLRKMLASLPDGVKTIIVDNSGQDRQALVELSDTYDVELIKNPMNLGFGVSCNIGAHAAQTKYLLFLNPDTIVHEGAIEALLQAAENYNNNTAFAPKMDDGLGKPYFKRRSVLLPRNEWLPSGWPKTECEVPVLSGAAIFVSKSFFSEVSFDPAIFMYHEDDDWSLRVRALGGKLVFVPTSHVSHMSGNSSGRDPLITQFKAFHLGKSKRYAFKKHDVHLGKLRCYLEAYSQLFLPQNIFSSRRRAKCKGFLKGVRKYKNVFVSPKVLQKKQLGTWWKIKREARRLVRQLKSAPHAFHDLFLSTLLYDRKKNDFITVIRNDSSSPKKIAIYLVFPQNGLQASHKRSLEYISTCGYAPYVVSNLSFNDDDLAYLDRAAWRTMTRPNVGYDFGGYRDALLELEKELPSLDRLVLINDSCWFPTPHAGNWFKEAEDLNLDYVGAASSFGIKRVEPEEFQTIKWRIDPNLRNFHYTSFALSIGPKLLSDPGFVRYWKQFPLTEVKNKVVRRGEIGLTKFVVKNGFSHGSTYDLLKLPEMLSTCSDEEINYFAQNLLFLDDLVTDQAKMRLLPTMDATISAPHREALIQFIMTISARIGVAYVLPEFLIRKNHFPFFKKSLAGINRKNSDIILNISKNLEGDGAAEIREEILAIRRDKDVENMPLEAEAYRL